MENGKEDGTGREPRVEPGKEAHKGDRTGPRTDGVSQLRQGEANVPNNCEVTLAV